MSALYPNVPQVDGVPTVLRDTGAYYDAMDDYVLGLDDDDYASPPSDADWGLYDSSGKQVVDPDAIISVEPMSEVRISDYPIQGGGFESYNRVQTPLQVRVTMAKGGTQQDRTDFLNALEQLRGSTDLCDAATPERVYVGLNLVHVSMARNAQNGAGMLTVEVGLQEVRQSATVAFSTATAADTQGVVDQANTLTGLTPGAPSSPSSGTPSASQTQAAVKQADTMMRNALPFFYNPLVPSASRIANQGAVQPTLLPGDVLLRKNADGSRDYLLK